MRIFLWVFSLLLPALAAAQTYEMRTPIPIYVASPAGGQCMVYSSANAYFTNGSCSGSSNFGFNAITTATNTTATMTCGTGCSITVSGSGSINATEIDGLTWPTLISGDCLTNNGTTLSWGICGGGGGSGTVTSFSFTNGNGFTGTVTNPTTTPALSLAMSSLSAIPAIGAYSFLANATASSASPTAVSSSSAVLADIQANTTFTVAGTGCTPSAHTGGPFSGTVTLAATCTAVTITMNGATGFTAPNGYHCNVGDKTAMAAGNNWVPAWTESASTTTTATLPIPSAAGATDVISFACTYF